MKLVKCLNVESPLTQNLFDIWLNVTFISIVYSNAYNMVLWQIFSPLVSSFFYHVENCFWFFVSLLFLMTEQMRIC
jgi:hypothetical protein